MLEGEEALLYDRQLRAFGLSKQESIRRSIVLIELTDYLLEELAKTCVILGFHTVICVGKPHSNVFVLSSLNKYCSVHLCEDIEVALDTLAVAVQDNHIAAVYSLVVTPHNYESIVTARTSLVVAAAAAEAGASTSLQWYTMGFLQPSAHEVVVTTQQSPDGSYALQQTCEVEDMYLLGSLVSYFVFALVGSCGAAQERDGSTAPQSCKLQYTGSTWCMRYQ